MMPRLAFKVTGLSDFFVRKQQKTAIAMTGFLLLALVFCQHFSEKAICADNAHPSVVCVIAWEPKAPTRGSGSLIGKKDSYGYVITNWHVVRDSTGLVMIRYADGTTAKGVVISVDSLWDLALIATTAPQAEPIRIASVPPKQGDPLWLAGYGADNTYKVVGGYCTKYISPSLSAIDEKELLEFTAAARKGDSGGPIFNKDGELAGVLFGTNIKVTMGSYCGRVLKFIDQSAPYVLAMPNNPDELFTLATAERRTILQRNTVTKPPVVNPSLPTTGNTVSQSVANYSSSSSFGGGGSKKRQANTQPVTDPFVSVESIQPYLGFQGFDYKKETVSVAAQSQNTTGQNISATSSDKSTFAKVDSPQIPPASTQNSRNLPPAASPGNGYTSSGSSGNPASGANQSISRSATPAREIPGGSVEAKPPSSTSTATPIPSYSAPRATSSPNSSSTSGSHHQDNRYGQMGAASTMSSGPGRSSSMPNQSDAASPPVTSSPYTAPSSNSSSYSSSYPGNAIPGNTSTSQGSNMGHAPEKISAPTSTYENKTNNEKRTQPNPDYFGGSYSNSSSLPSRRDSSYSYVDEAETELLEGEIHEKYALGTAIVKPGSDTASQSMMTSRNAIKIIGAVIVIFFVLFHAVKLMSIIEEQ